MNARPRATSLIVAGAVLAASAAGACGDSGSSGGDGPASPCTAFARALPARLEPDAVARPSRPDLVAIEAFGGKLYGLDRSGVIIDATSTSTGAGSPRIIGDLAVTKNTRGEIVAYGVRTDAAAGPAIHDLVRLTSLDGGLTFPAASAKVLLTMPKSVTESSLVTMGFGADGLLYVAIGDPAVPGGVPDLFGQILRLDVSGDDVVIPPGNVADPARPQVWARAALRAPRGLDVDPMTGDVWLTDETVTGVTRVYRLVRSAPDEVKPILELDAADRRASFGGGHVSRGSRARELAGKYVYPANDGLVAIAPFGPSGNALATKLGLAESGPIGRDERGELVVLSARGIVAVTEVAPADPSGAVPTSLLATKCFDPAAPGGVVVGAIAYDVTAPLWSDGANKDRFVVVPRGEPLTTRTDGDLVFPVGTVAVKTFAIDGRRIETRLLVQHDLESWVGYSYAWNEAGTDAELVSGNRVTALPGGKSWYFPSATDCTACHTPAAGYTLGLEAKQLAGRGDALAKLSAKVRGDSAPLEAAPLSAIDAPPPATKEARARSYLHSNCSMCHREGSATGVVVDLDLRADTPLAKTGLCGDAKAGSLGAATRLVVPHEPASSVLVARMRATDERRMPKLASRVVDEVGVAAVEAWIADLASCP